MENSTGAASLMMIFRRNGHRYIREWDAANSDGSIRKSWEAK